MYNIEKKSSGCSGVPTEIFSIGTLSVADGSMVGVFVEVGAGVKVNVGLGIGVSVRAGGGVSDGKGVSEPPITTLVA